MLCSRTSTQSGACGPQFAYFSIVLRRPRQRLSNPGGRFLAQQLTILETKQVKVSLVGLLSGEKKLDFSANGISVTSGAATTILHLSSAFVVPSDFIGGNSDRLKSIVELKEKADRLA